MAGAGAVVVDGVLHGSLQRACIGTKKQNKTYKGINYSAMLERLLSSLIIL